MESTKKEKADSRTEDKVVVSETARDARTKAANDISKDPDTHVSDSADDPDEGELAREDGSRN
ncbi:MAG: hypothetical protein EOO09_14505 [Chitinophagaceae bacterium]|nr:MAG: hypothetical protein EOO09_14505 [Chitinophagaceae bacterium]